MREIINKSEKSLEDDLPFSECKEKSDPAVITKPGIYTISGDQYHTDPCVTPSLSASIAKTLLSRSPHHAWIKHPRLNPNFKEEHRRIFDPGSAAHSLLLEGDAATLAVILNEDGSYADSYRTKVAQEAKAEAYKNGLIPVLRKEEIVVRRMVEVAKAFIETTELAGTFLIGKPEQTLIWQEDGIWCRGRVDLLTNEHRTIVDYKTTTNASPEYWIKSHIMDNLMQVAFYLNGIYQLFTVNATFVFLVQENTPPYDCSLISPSETLLDIGRSNVKKAVKLWNQCLQSDKWDGYGNLIHYADAPGWALYQHEQELLKEEMFDELPS